MNCAWLLFLVSFLFAFVYGAVPTASTPTAAAADLSRKEICKIVFFGLTWWEVVHRNYPSAVIFLSRTELKQVQKTRSEITKKKLPLGFLLTQAEAVALADSDVDRILEKFKRGFKHLTGQELRLVAAPNTDVSEALREAFHRNGIELIETVAWSEEAAKAGINYLGVDTANGDYELLAEVFDFSKEYHSIQKKAAKAARAAQALLIPLVESVESFPKSVESSPKSLKSSESGAFTDAETPLSASSIEPASPKSLEDESDIDG